MEEYLCRNYFFICSTRGTKGGITHCWTSNNTEASPKPKPKSASKGTDLCLGLIDVSVGRDI